MVARWLMYSFQGLLCRFSFKFVLYWIHSFGTELWSFAESSWKVQPMEVNKIWLFWPTFGMMFDPRIFSMLLFLNVTIISVNYIFFNCVFRIGSFRSIFFFVIECCKDSCKLPLLLKKCFLSCSSKCYSF